MGGTFKFKYTIIQLSIELFFNEQISRVNIKKTKLIILKTS